MQDTLPSCRRGKLAAPTISSLNKAARVGCPPTGVISSSPATTAKRTTPHSSSEAKASLPQRAAKPSLGRSLPTECVNPASHPFSESPSNQRLCDVALSRANSSRSGRKSLSQASPDSSMASLEKKTVSKALKTQSFKPTQPPINLKRTCNDAKNTEMNQRRTPYASAQPRKSGGPTTKFSDNKVSNEIQESEERSFHGGTQSGPAAYSKVRREKLIARVRRRGYYVADLQSRRKGLTERGHPFKRERQLLSSNSDRGHPFKRAERQLLSRNSVVKPFPLTSLEEYLKEKGQEARHGVHANTEDSESPSSHIAHLQQPNLQNISNQRLVFVGDSRSQFVDLSLEDPRLLTKFSVHTYLSADELDDAARQLNSDKSICSMSLHRPASGRTSSKNDSLLHYAGSCFSVSRRRVGGRRRQVAYMYNSEGSMSSFDSEAETVPLMTEPEPEPWHGYTDNCSVSSVEVDEQHAPSVEQGGKLSYNGFKDTHTNEACFTVDMEIPLKKLRENACKHRSISQKYRPKSFNDLQGQKMVSESLSNAILRNKIAPLYLFHGPRGTGKTTAAKIFTCAMNCLSIEELRPCGLCNQCNSFHAGNIYDVKEVDVAANNEIESMRVMLKHLSLPPSTTRYKVFIMDDCHMLTGEAWNALLKSLEDPPEYVVFILITTNVEQLPKAATSRCQKFVFNRIKDADVVFRLQKLAQQEKVEIDAEALQFIAAQSDGSLRDAETMLDQLSLLGSRITLSTVREMVGLIPEEKLINLLELALSADTVSTVSNVRELMGSGVEPLALVSQLATLITDVLAGRCQSARDHGQVRKDQQDKLHQALRVLSDCEKQLRSCSDRTTWLTAAFLQLASNNACSRPSSSRGTSVAQSPKVFLEVHGKETLNCDYKGRRRSWGGKEMWEAHAPVQQECGQAQSFCEYSSGPYVDNRIHPCDHSPQSCTSVDEKSVCGLPATMSQSVRSKSNTLSPCAKDEIWQKVLHGSCSNALKQLLQREGRLIALSVTEAFAIVKLEFQSPEHRSMAERASQFISNAFQSALFCPVKLEITSSLPQGQSGFSCRADTHPPQIHSEHHSKRILFDQEDECLHEQGKGSKREGSFRKSSSNSFRNMEPVMTSPICHSSECRKSMQHEHEGDAHTYRQRIGDASFKDLQIHRRSGENNVNSLQASGNGGVANGHSTDKEHRGSFEDPRLSASLRWSDIRGDSENNSDSEVDTRYGPGLLCWKGPRMKDEKAAKHHVLRRRRARFLLRLVPCGKEEDQ